MLYFPEFLSVKLIPITLGTPRQHGANSTLRFTTCPSDTWENYISFLPKCRTEWPAYNSPSCYSQHSNGSLVHIPSSHGYQRSVHTEATGKESCRSEEMKRKDLTSGTNY
jgi:hypothetical protein